MKKAVLITIILLSVQGLFAQNGAIKGQILDENNEPVFAAAVYVEYGTQKIHSTTNEKGYYTIKPLNSGTYSLHVICLGYREKIINGIQVTSDKIVMMSPEKLQVKSEVLAGPVIVGRKNKIIDPDNVSRTTMLPAQLSKMPDNKNIGAILRNISPEVNISENNKTVIIRGSRSGESACFVDGVKQRDFSATLPGNAIGRLTMYTGGIPAKYGDITGGIVILETKSYFDLLNEYKGNEMARESEKPASTETSIEEEEIDNGN